ncbi:MAG: sugar phosphate isomerase/epimerase [Clostridia bacterium]|nr:sugar phosphate isomerase/epimerase [Clostridia bacterium]
MFDITIGTLIPVNAAAAMIPQLNQKGFECYALDFNGTHPAQMDFSAIAEELASVLDGRSITAVGYYSNPILIEECRNDLRALIGNAPKLGCHVIGAFAGGNPEKSVPDTIPQFQKTWEPLASLAEEVGVKIGFEGCGGGWYRGSTNIAFCAEAWELMFDAVRSPALGLEWEPCHIMEGLGDPISQLRHWANKVVHIHGKDCTICWDVVREYGIRGPKPYVFNRTPGFGDNNWADIFTILLQAGYVGACDIEGYHDPVHFDDMEWTAQVTSLDYLKRCRGGMEYFAGPTEYRGYQGKRKA